MKLSAILEDIGNLQPGYAEKGEIVNPEGKSRTVGGTRESVRASLKPGEVMAGHTHGGPPIPSATDIENLHRSWSDAIDNGAEPENLFHYINGYMETNGKKSNYRCILRPTRNFKTSGINIKNAAREYQAAVNENDMEKAEKALERAGFSAEIGTM